MVAPCLHDLSKCDLKQVQEGSSIETLTVHSPNEQTIHNISMQNDTSKLYPNRLRSSFTSNLDICYHTK